MNHAFIFSILITIVISISSCSPFKPMKEFKSDSTPITHETWDALLKKHVSVDGWVNYNGMIQDSTTLNEYLTLLSSSQPNKKNWSSEESFAYWINAYNAFTVKLIVDNYPTASIKDIKNGIPFVSTVWDIKFIKIEGHEYDLNNIEHNIIRPKYDDPRAHAAVNCASYSCPKLLNAAYVPEKLDEQLDASFAAFINDPQRNEITPDNPKLSKLLKWYSGDFEVKGKSLIDYLNNYSDVKINSDAKIEYKEYIWTLNEQQ